MWANFGELWLQTRITVTFWYTILCILTCITWKLQVVYEHSTYQMTVLLSEMSISWVRSAFEMWLVRYGSKHSSSLFPIHHLWALMRNLKTTGCIPTGCLHIKWLLYSQRHSFCGLELYERSNWRVMAPNIRLYLWYNLVCILQTHTYDCTAHQKMALLPKVPHFIRAKSYVMTYKLLQSIRCSVFPITVDVIDTCMLILKLIRSSTILLDKLSEHACASTLQWVWY